MSLLSRTNSSPNVQSKQRNLQPHWKSNLQANYPTTKSSQPDHSYGGQEIEADEEFYVIGDRVFVDGFKGASVAYFGEVEFAAGDWIGVVLDEPLGSHSGKLHGREYFQCAPLHGLFVRAHRVSRIPFTDSAFGSSGSTSRVSTPSNYSNQQQSTPPARNPLWLLRSANRQQPEQLWRSSSRSPGSSLMGSEYYYDDDYRQESAPTVASLTRKLRSLNQRGDNIKSSMLDRNELEDDSSGRRRTAGILKRSQSMNSGRGKTMIGDEDFGNDATITPATNTSARAQHRNSSVFNFRPKRAELNEFLPNSGGSPISRYQVQSSPAGRVSVDLSSEPARIGDRVTARSERGDICGLLRFLGETEFATGEWAGIELDRAEGKNDGSVLGRRYFYCQPNYGLFVPATRMQKSARQRASQSEFESMRSTILSPPPPPITQTRPMQHSRASSYSTGSSYSGDRSTTPMSQLDYKYSSPSSASALSTSPIISPTPFYPQQSKLSSSWTRSSTPVESSLANKTHSYYNSSFDLGPRPKFDDQDIDRQLKKVLNSRPGGQRIGSAASLLALKPYQQTRLLSSSLLEPIKPKSVRYTFSSSKYDGNPVVRRTVEY